MGCRACSRSGEARKPEQPGRASGRCAPTGDGVVSTRIGSRDLGVHVGPLSAPEPAAHGSPGGLAQFGHEHGCGRSLPRREAEQAARDLSQDGSDQNLVRLPVDEVRDRLPRTASRSSRSVACRASRRSSRPFVSIFPAPEGAKRWLRADVAARRRHGRGRGRRAARPLEPVADIEQLRARDRRASTGAREGDRVGAGMGRGSDMIRTCGRSTDRRDPRSRRSDAPGAVAQSVRAADS